MKFLTGKLKIKVGFFGERGLINERQLRMLDADEDILIILCRKIPFIERYDMPLLDTLFIRTSLIFTWYGVKLALNVEGNPRFRAMERERYLELARKAADCDVLIYQPGKVGSSSVYQSLLEFQVRVIHTHILNPVHFRRNPEIEGIVRQLRNREGMKIISLVRDPIARDFSDFFDLLGASGKTPSIRRSATFEESFWECMEVACAFDCGCFPPEINLRDGREFAWFDNELKAVFEVDVFDYDFDREAGYTVIKERNLELLVIKLEKLGQLESVIGDFIEIPDFKLKWYNNSQGKDYKYLYNDFKKHMAAPRYLLDYYYRGNASVDHFYTEEEKEEFYYKWKGSGST